MGRFVAALVAGALLVELVIGVVVMFCLNKGYDGAAVFACFVLMVGAVVMGSLLATSDVVTSLRYEWERDRVLDRQLREARQEADLAQAAEEGRWLMMPVEGLMSETRAEPPVAIKKGRRS